MIVVALILIGVGIFGAFANMLYSMMRADDMHDAGWMIVRHFIFAAMYIGGILLFIIGLLIHFGII